MPIATRSSEERSRQAVDKAERARDRVIAMQEYEARQVAMRENMVRLRALRLAKEANEVPAAKPKARRTRTANFSD